MHPVSTNYDANAPLWVKRLASNAIRRLLPEPLVEIKAPSSTIATLNQWSTANRWVLHLLHSIPELRGTACGVIEDVIPLSGVAVRVRTGKQVKQVRAVAQGQTLEFRQEGADTAFTPPQMVGHQMIVLEY